MSHDSSERATGWLQECPPELVPSTHNLHIQLLHLQDGLRPAIRTDVQPAGFAHPIWKHPSSYTASVVTRSHLDPRVWDALARRGPVLPISSDSARPLKSSRPTFYNYQPDHLYAKETVGSANLWPVSERTRPFVPMEKARSPSSANEKWENRETVAFMFLFSVSVIVWQLKRISKALNKHERKKPWGFLEVISDICRSI